MARKTAARKPKPSEPAVGALNMATLHVRDLDASVRFWGETCGLPRQLVHRLEVVTRPRACLRAQGRATSGDTLLHGGASARDA